MKYCIDLLCGHGLQIRAIGAFKLFNKGNTNALDLLHHEFGHILEARKVGLDAFYHVIAPESLATSRLPIADNYWTETWANSLSQHHFKYYFNNTTRYPAAPLSDYGRIRLLLYTLRPVSGN